MTVEELIDELNKIENKKADVYLQYRDNDPYYGICEEDVCSVTEEKEHFEVILNKQ